MVLGLRPQFLSLLSLLFNFCRLMRCTCSVWRASEFCCSCLFCSLSCPVCLSLSLLCAPLHPRCVVYHVCSESLSLFLLCLAPWPSLSFSSVMLVSHVFLVLPVLCPSFSALLPLSCQLDFAQPCFSGVSSLPRFPVCIYILSEFHSVCCQDFHHAVCFPHVNAPSL